MQFVTGISSAQTVPAAPAPTAAGRKPSLWILDSWRDLVLYVCTPLLLVPMFIAAQGVWAAEDIYLCVAAFGAMGHHLPGMMQTYGFCRIYDAKVGSFAEITRRLDFGLCGIWFATAVLLSPQRMTDTLETYYSAGGPFVPPAVLRAGQQGLLALALLLSAL